MIYFLHGADTFRSRKKLDEIVSAFREKAGGFFNITNADVEDEAEAVLALGRTRSLFSPKELIILKRPSSGGERVLHHIREHLARWNDDPNLTVVVWEDGEADARDPLLDAVKKVAFKTQEFKPLAQNELQQWLERELASRKMKISFSEKQAFLDGARGDLWKMSQLVEMRSFGWVSGRSGSRDPRIWDFTDAFLQSGRRSFRPLQDLLAQGFDAIQILGAFASSLKTLSLVWFGGRTAGLHPFAVRKNKEIVRTMSADDLERLFRDAREGDLEMKTGRISGPLALARIALARRPDQREKTRREK